MYNHYVVLIANKTVYIRNNITIWKIYITIQLHLLINYYLTYNDSLYVSNKNI